MLVKFFCKFCSLCEKQFYTFTFVVVLLIFLYFIISYPSRYLNFMSIRYLYLLINSCTTVTHIVVELAEHSPIIIQNSSNPSCQKNLDVRLYDWLYKVLLLAQALSYNQSSTWTRRSCEWKSFNITAHFIHSFSFVGKKMQAPLLGLPKSIYY